MLTLLGLTCTLLLGASCERKPGDKPMTAFDGQAALAYTKAQVDFGPRVPGTEAARRAGDWIVAQMRQRADTVIVQEWKNVTAKGDTLPLRNILARFRPELTNRVLYVTHWDTRPTSDEELDPANRTKTMPGANDGASGVGLFVALGDALKKTPPTVGVDLLFVDGEDWGDFDTYDANAPSPSSTEVLLGSQYFAAHPPTPDYKPLYGVLFDMIGDRDLQIYQELNSADAAPEIVQRVWQQADELGYARYFIPQARIAITDDHIPFIKRGYRMIDVIDIDYGPIGPRGQPDPNYHHTLQDTIDKVSARSLQVVGDVALALVTQ